MISIKGNASVINGLKPRIIIGIVAAIIISAITVLLGPIFILNEYLSPTSVYITAILTQGIGALICAVVAGKGIGEGKCLAVSISVGLFNIALICVGMLFFDSDIDKVITGIMSSAVGVACALFLINRKKKVLKRKRLKYRSR